MSYNQHQENINTIIHSHHCLCQHSGIYYYYYYYWLTLISIHRIMHVRSFLPQILSFIRLFVFIYVLAILQSSRFGGRKLTC